MTLSRRTFLQPIRTPSVSLEMNFAPGALEAIGGGFAITNADHNCPRVTAWYRQNVWQLPEDRFVIYEASDEPWCRALGIGHETERLVSVEFPRAELAFDGRKITVRPKADPFRLTEFVA